MTTRDCPDKNELLAWLQDSSHTEQDALLAAHLDSCNSCQIQLENICQAEERKVSSSSSVCLLADLRREPPPCDLESEPDCEQACYQAQAVMNQTADGASDTSRSGLRTHPMPAQLGHYQILERLGHGGMGVVYKARQVKLDRLVAIKVLPDDKLVKEGAVARFEREMKAVARLSHPNIVIAHDADEADGKHFLVLEYVDGEDLKSVVQNHGPLPVGKAIDCILQATRGLHYAHEHGIIHRDVKPSNLMLDRSGAVKVLDLGLARIVSAEHELGVSTESGVIMGTMDYMSPEQADNPKNADMRADIYSLGCTLYFLLTGQPLYEGGSAIQKILAHRDRPIPKLCDLSGKDLSNLEPIFSKMVAKRPEQRYQTMSDLIADLEGFRANEESAVSAPRTPKRRPHWRVSLVIGASAVLALLVVGLIVLRPFSNSRVSRDDGIRKHGQTSALPPKYTNELGMDFILVGKGSFWMGGGGGMIGSKKVTVDHDFYMGAREVTQGQWEAVIGVNPSHFQIGGDGGNMVADIAKKDLKHFPVEKVSWNDAQKFLEGLNKREKETGWRYRLPTEIEWEYACRGGPTAGKSDCSFSFYVGKPANTLLPKLANFRHANGLNRTCMVGSYPPNRLGLYDMHGNVWEWCDSAVPNENGPAYRVLRGGGWYAIAADCRAANRDWRLPSLRDPYLGLRVARVPVQSSANQDNGNTGMAPPSARMLPGRRYDLMPLIPESGSWKITNEGLFQNPIRENQVITVPVHITGSYQLKSTFTRKSGNRSVNFYFPVGRYVGVLYLDVEDVSSLVIDGKAGKDSPAKRESVPLKTGHRYELTIDVRLHGDDAAIKIDLDGKRHLEWRGPKFRLQSHTSSGRFALGSRDGDTIFHNLSLQPTDGHADVK